MLATATPPFAVFINQAWIPLTTTPQRALSQAPYQLSGNLSAHLLHLGRWCHTFFSQLPSPVASSVLHDAETFAITGDRDRWAARDLYPKRGITMFTLPPHMLDLYVKTWCPWCVSAVETLDALGCRYIIHDVEKDPSGAATVRALSGQSKVPTLRAGDAVLADFGPEEVEPFLRKHGLLPGRP